MYSKVLAPLDGSELAECTLEHVKAISKGCGTQDVILLSVIEPIPPSFVLPGVGREVLPAEKKIRSAVEAYLSKMAASLKKEGIAARGVVISDQSAAEGILDYAKDNKVDLIVISTHGKSGPSRWLLGSVADKVARHSEVPLLVIAPAACR